MEQETDQDVWVTIKVKRSFRDRTKQAIKELGSVTDLSKEVKKTMRGLIIEAGLDL